MEKLSSLPLQVGVVDQRASLHLEEYGTEILSSVLLLAMPTRFLLPREEG